MFVRRVSRRAGGARLYGHTAGIDQQQKAVIGLQKRWPGAVCDESDRTPTSPIFMHVNCGRGSVLLWRRGDMLCTSGFMDDVVFASTSPPGWGSEAHTQLWARRVGMPVAGSGRSGLFLAVRADVGRIGRVEYSWHHVCTWCPCV